MKSESIELAETESKMMQITIPYTLDSDLGCRVKVFLWDENMQPLSIVTQTPINSTALAAVKLQAQNEMSAEFSEYDPADYTAGNWLLLYEAYNEGHSAIYQAITPEEVTKAKVEAIQKMKEICFHVQA